MIEHQNITWDQLTRQCLGMVIGWLRAGIGNTAPGPKLAAGLAWAEAVLKRDEDAVDEARARWNGLNAEASARREKTKGSLPRRGDEDLHEATDAPIFLMQRRRFSIIDGAGISWDDDREILVDDEEIELTEEKAVARGLGQWEWDTQLVAFSRTEAQEWCDARPYRGPWRVYSVPTMGELRTLLKAQTDYDQQEATHGDGRTA